jgi:hypothetical protein
MILKTIFFSVICACALALDCVPLTFSRLDSRVTYDEWRAILMPDDNPPGLLDAIKQWNARDDLPKLQCVYSRLNAISAVESTIRFNYVYWWVGIMPENMVVPNQISNCHAALLIFKDDGIVTLVHVLNITSTHEEVITEEEFFRRTVLVFELE